MGLAALAVVAKLCRLAHQAASVSVMEVTSCPMGVIQEEVELLTMAVVQLVGEALAQLLPVWSL